MGKKPVLWLSGLLLAGLSVPGCESCSWCKKCNSCSTPPGYAASTNNPNTIVNPTTQKGWDSRGAAAKADAGGPQVGTVPGTTGYPVTRTTAPSAGATQGYTNSQVTPVKGIAEKPFAMPQQGNIVPADEVSRIPAMPMQDGPPATEPVLVPPQGFQRPSEAPPVESPDPNMLRLQGIPNTLPPMQPDRQPPP